MNLIDHKYLESGHTSMEVDSVHSAIEHAKKSVDVFISENWHTVVQMARRKHPYSIIPMHNKDIINFEVMSDSFPCTGKVKWRKVKWVRYIKHENGEVAVLFKNDFTDEFEQVSSRKTRKVQPEGIISQSKYGGPLQITDVKKTDLLSLCSDGTIPEVYHSFYKDLPSAKDREYRLPQPDKDETSDDE